MRAHKAVHIQRGDGGRPLYHTSLYLAGGIGADDVGADDQDDQGHEHEPLEQRDLARNRGQRRRQAANVALQTPKRPPTNSPGAGSSFFLGSALPYPISDLAPQWLPYP